VIVIFIVSHAINKKRFVVKRKDSKNYDVKLLFCIQIIEKGSYPLKLNLLLEQKGMKSITIYILLDVDSSYESYEYYFWFFIDQFHLVT